MNIFPERCIVTLSDTPDEPGKVAGVLGLDVTGVTAECTLVARTYSDTPRAMVLPGYPVCVEPISALVVRLLALSKGEAHQAVPRGFARYASLSLYRGPNIDESRLVEHLVVRSSPVSAALVSLQVEFADELEERTTRILATSCRSPWALLERAVACLWWSGGQAPVLRPLSEVPIRSDAGVGQVREVDIPVYARKRLLRHLGGFRGPSPDAFFAEDWLKFLGLLSSEQASRAAGD